MNTIKPLTCRITPPKVAKSSFQGKEELSVQGIQTRNILFGKVLEIQQRVSTLIEKALEQKLSTEDGGEIPSTQIGAIEFTSDYYLEQLKYHYKKGKTPAALLETKIEEFERSLVKFELDIFCAEYKKDNRIPKI